MSKYEKINNYKENLEMKNILVDGENILWEGKPKKAAFIINKILPMMPIALFWFLIDMGIFSAFLFDGINGMNWFIIPFMLLHLMPVWIWLGNILTASKKWENTSYVMTDKRIIISSGFIGTDYNTIYYKDINRVDLKVGLVDKLLNVGDVYFTVLNNGVQAFFDIKDAYQIYPKIQKAVLDIQTDIEFPNNLRPDKNDGFKTSYNKKL